MRRRDGRNQPARAEPEHGVRAAAARQGRRVRDKDAGGIGRPGRRGAGRRWATAAAQQQQPAREQAGGSCGEGAAATQAASQQQTGAGERAHTRAYTTVTEAYGSQIEGEKGGFRGRSSR